MLKGLQGLQLQLGDPAFIQDLVFNGEHTVHV